MQPTIVTAAALELGSCKFVAGGSIIICKAHSSDEHHLSFLNRVL